MTGFDWGLALTLCLILSLAWAALLFGICRLAEPFLPAAEDRHGLWWIALLASVMPLAALAVLGLAGTSAEPAAPPPFLGGILGTPAAGSGVEVSAPAGGGFLPFLLAGLRSSVPLVLAIYGLGLLWHGASWLRSRHRLKRLLARCRPLEDAPLQGAVAEWAVRLGVKRAPAILETAEPVSAFTAHWRRPVLVLPEGLLKRCEPHQTALICAHELAHLARRDLLIMPVQTLLRAVLWFNPAVAGMAVRLDMTREVACDDRVLNIEHHSRPDYAQAFVHSLRHASAPVACGIPFIHPCRKDHEMRLTHIMKGEPGTSRKWRLVAAGLAIAAITFPIAGKQAALADTLAAKAPEFSGAIVAATGARLTSPYGPRVLKGEERFHHGVDIGAPMGTPVKSPGEGRVLIVSGDHKGYGKRIEIDYGGGWQMIFSQLNGYDVAVGDDVAAGQQIGTVGMSGVRATGPHLHLEVLHNGKHVDPATVLSIPGWSVEKEKAVQN